MYLVLDVVLACARIVAANLACEHTVHAKPAADALAEQRHAALLHALMRTNTRHVRQRQRAHARLVHARRTAGSAPGASVVVSTAMSGDRGGGGGADTYTRLPPLASAATLAGGGGGGGADTYTLLPLLASAATSPLVYCGTGPTPKIPASADASKNASGDSVRDMRCFV
jgi:hypothetical protein